MPSPVKQLVLGFENTLATMGAVTRRTLIGRCGSMRCGRREPSPLRDRILEASDRATIIAERIAYACSEQAGAMTDRPDPYSEPPPIIGESPSVILLKGVVIDCELIHRIFDEMPASEPEPYTYLGEMMELLGDASGRTANFDSQDARTALAESGR